MRILLFLLFPIFLSAQINRAYGVIEIGGFPTSSATGPKFAYRPADSSFYRWVSGSTWVKIIPDEPDTLYLKQLSGTTALVDGDTIDISTYLLKSDTTSLLASYIRSAGWGLLKTTKTLTVDSSKVASKYYVSTSPTTIAANYIATSNGSNLVARNLFDNNTYVGILNSKPFMLGQWTTAGRPSAANGYLGRNTSTGFDEGYYSSEWRNLVTSTGAISTQVPVFSSAGKIDGSNNLTYSTNFSLLGNTNSTLSYQVTNSSSSNAAAAGMVAVANNGKLSVFAQSGSGYTNNAIIGAQSGYIYSDGTGGLALLAIAGSMRFATNAVTEAMRITSTGRVGIGNFLSSTVDWALHVKNNLNAPVSLISENTSSGASANSAFGAKNDNGKSTVIGISSTGYTGIPGIGANAGYIYNEATNGFNFISIPSAPIKFTIGGTGTADEKMRLQQTGNLLIGTTTDVSRRLHVSGEARITDLTTDPPTQIVGADADGDLGALGLSNLTISGGSLTAQNIYNIDGTFGAGRIATLTDSLRFQFGGSDLLRLKSNGVLHVNMPTKNNSFVVTSTPSENYGNYRGRVFLTGTTSVGDTATGTRRNNHEASFFSGINLVEGGNNVYYDAVSGYGNIVRSNQPKNIVYGTYNTLNSGSNNEAYGYLINITGSRVTVFGRETTVTGSDITAIGRSNTITQSNSFIYGSNISSGTNLTKHGFGTVTPSARVHAKSLSGVPTILADGGEIQANAYGTGTKEAADLSKTQSNYLTSFATDGTVLELGIGSGLKRSGGALDLKRKSLIDSLPIASVVVNAATNNLEINNLGTVTFETSGGALIYQDDFETDIYNPEYAEIVAGTGAKITLDHATELVGIKGTVEMEQYSLGNKKSTDLGIADTKFVPKFGNGGVITDYYLARDTFIEDVTLFAVGTLMNSCQELTVVSSMTSTAPSHMEIRFPDASDVLRGKKIIVYSKKKDAGAYVPQIKVVGGVSRLYFTTNPAVGGTDPSDQSTLSIDDSTWSDHGTSFEFTCLRIDNTPSYRWVLKQR